MRWNLKSKNRQRREMNLLSKVYASSLATKTGNGWEREEKEKCKEKEWEEKTI